VVRERVAARRTGARWQAATVAALERSQGREAALTGMLARYRELASSGEPVHGWPVPR
jgi:hypothetical protein